MARAWHDVWIFKWVFGFAFFTMHYYVYEPYEVSEINSLSNKFC